MLAVQLVAQLLGATPPGGCAPCSRAGSRPRAARNDRLNLRDAGTDRPDSEVDRVRAESRAAAARLRDCSLRACVVEDLGLIAALEDLLAQA